MAKQFKALSSTHRDFIQRQHIFFVSSATADSRVNISPREISALRILDDHSVTYLDRTGSGNETAAHMLADGRLTIMFAPFLELHKLCVCMVRVHRLVGKKLSLKI